MQGILSLTLIENEYTIFLEDKINCLVTNRRGLRRVRWLVRQSKGKAAWVDSINV
jgi:hypothetical protein